MFYYFKNLNLSLNNFNLLASDIQLESDIEVIHPLKLDERTSKINLPNKSYISNLKIKYYLTGQDPLKPYLYSLENEKLTGNFCGFLFNQSYISSYSTTFIPNSPIEINANIQIFDKVSGNFTTSSPQNQTGVILRTSDINIDNLSNYTSAPLTNVVQATYNYNCKLSPSYSYDSGNEITRADRVSIEDRTWEIEIVSDSTDLNIPLSGQNFALTISGINPYNNQINESFSASGVITNKQFNISNNKVHSHILKLTQNHSSNFGGISGIIINTNNFEIDSNPNSHPFTNGGLNCIDKIVVGDTICTGFTVASNSTNDKITVSTPSNIINGPLSIFSSKGNFLWPNTLNFSYPNIQITGVSQYSGFPGTPIYISGNNFYRISQINYGGVNSTFQTISPNLLLSIVPLNGITSDIQLISDLRNLTGYTNQFFYCQPSITLLTPVTGVWGDTLVVGGINFSGTTGVKFGTGFVDAGSYTITNNDTLLITSPTTGSGYSEGYITVLTSGGSTQSISRYNPQVPLYSFSGSSGIYFDKVTLSLTVDSGYLSPTGGGYKVRLGTIDTIFYQNGTGLTGQVPFGGQTDYIYIYKPDGVSTYTPNFTQYTVHSVPKIFSITPAVINQYQYVNPVLIGENFEFFTSQLPYFYAISGGINGDMQTGKNMIANSGGNADTIYISNLQVTGNTGYYDILIQNFAGTGIFKSGLLVNTGINQSSNCRAIIVASKQQLGNYFASLSIDNSTGTFAGLKCNTITSGVSLVLTPKNNNLLTISLIKTIVSNVDAYDDITNRTHGQLYNATPSGSITMWYKNANSPFYSSPIQDLTNAEFNLFNSGITGVASIKVYTPAIANNDNKYLGISELQIY